MLTCIVDNLGKSQWILPYVQLSAVSHADSLGKNRLLFSEFCVQFGTKDML